ncbi:MAG: hypothetical protein FJW46_05830 [Actinobacteria bacterium]|nr:hypothetical protein [Actinomycetota bacterium]
MKELNVTSLAKDIVLNWVNTNGFEKEPLMIAQGGIGFNKEVFLILFEDELVQCKFKKEQIFGERYHLSEYQGCKYSMGGIQVTFADKQGKAKIVILAVKKESAIDIQSTIAAAHFSFSKRGSDSQLQKSALNQSVSRGDLIGTLLPESGVQLFERSSSKYGDRKFGDLLKSGGKTIQIYSNFLECEGNLYEIDKQVTADVIFDGQVQVSRRPTLTRMGLLSPLPGSALIAGFALGKKETHDSREVHVVIAHPEWALSIRVKPGDLAHAQMMAGRINALADSKREEVRTADPVSTGDKLSKLQEVKSLLNSGFISEQEAQKMKSEILGHSPDNS